MENPRTRSINFGQLILALGGNARLVGCRLLRFRPYGNGVFRNIVMGNDMLVIAGACVVQPAPPLAFVRTSTITDSAASYITIITQQATAR